MMAPDDGDAFQRLPLSIDALLLLLYPVYPAALATILGGRAPFGCFRCVVASLRHCSIRYRLLPRPGA